MAYVYILYSENLDKFYVGSCLNLEERITEHSEKKYQNSYTAKIGSWNLFLSIENLDYSQARLIEGHIKKMKSKKYIRNLKLYSDMVQKLIEKYS